MIRLYLTLGLVAAIFAAFFLVRSDATNDAIREIEADANADRLKHIEETREAISDVQNIPDAGIRNALCEQLRPNDADCK